MDPACAAGIDILARLIKLEASDMRQWSAIEAIRDRPPVWATVAISILMFALGCAVTLVAARS
jgi:hypothetical protein